MRSVHLVTNLVFPAPGGLEKSVVAIADMMSELPGTSVHIYTRHLSHENGDPRETTGRHSVTHLATATSVLRQPFDGVQLPQEDKFRFDYLTLRSAVDLMLKKSPEKRHLLVSFFASSTGFVTQKVSEDLGLPHIASIRGSDFSVGAYAPNTGYALEYVCRRAAAVVTTNDSQLRAVRRMFDRGTQLRTIYNSVEYQPKIRPKSENLVIFSDAGLSFKKGTQILLRAFQTIASEFPQARLAIAGGIDLEHKGYWNGILQEVSDGVDGRISYFGHLTEEQLKYHFENAAVYASATLAEGCSTGRLKAVASLIPVATTRTGEVLDRGDLPHLFVCEPGDSDGFVEVLRNAVNWHISSERTCDPDLVRHWIEPMHPRLVRNAWEVVVNSVVPKYENVPRATQPRLLFFCHDGTGIGHLQRLARIAGAMQGPCASLVVTGHSTAGWIVPKECEFVHLPSLDSLIVSRARYWGREPFLHMPIEEAKIFRNNLLSQVINWFQPDALFVDFLPIGKNRELADVVFNRNCKKYFVLRGVLDDARNVRIDVLGGNGEQALEDHYDRIFVACDPRVIDVAKEYSLSERISRKLIYTGYVAPESTRDARAATRLRRGVPEVTTWVVCSAGGGKLGERLIEECLRIAAVKTNMFFDIVLGPRSSIGNEALLRSEGLPRVRVLSQTTELPELHAAANIVICAGGYNSIVEAIAGESEIICVPVQLDTDDEQFIHARRLAEWYRLQMVTAPHKIEEALDRAAEWLGTSPVKGCSKLDLSGATAVRNHVLDDMNIAAYL